VQLREPDRHFRLTPEDIALLNPNTKTCPVFRSKRDCELTKAIYRRVPVWVDETKGAESNPWGFQGLLMFMMNTASGLFHTTAAPGLVALYEGKMFQAYDHRAASVETVLANLKRPGQPREVTLDDHKKPAFFPMPQYWIATAAVEARLLTRWKRDWLLAFKRITSATNERTAVFTVLPRVGVGDNAPLIFLRHDLQPTLVSCLIANINSFVFDFVARQKLGGNNMSFFIVNQLPCLPPAAYSYADAAYTTLRVLELIYTAWDMEPFARDLAYDGPPFPWDEERRFRLRCELDAYYFHLYRIGRDDVDYIMDTFPIVKRKDEARYGEYRTKRVILEVYDALATEMDPPLRRVAEGRVAYGAS